MTMHLPREMWQMDKPADDKLITQFARAVISNKEFAHGEDGYTPAAFGIYSPGDQLVFSVAQILEISRDDPEARELCITVIGGTIVDPLVQENVANILRAVTARVIELEESQDDDPASDSQEDEGAGGTPSPEG